MNSIKKTLKGSFLYPIYRKTLGKLVENRRIKSAKDELQKNGKTLIAAIFDTLERNDIKIFLNFGSLLGIIRDGRFMNYDYDIDFGVFCDESFSWDKLNNVLNSLGAQKVKQFTLDSSITEQTYRIGKLDIDFFAHTNEEEKSIEFFYFKEDDEVYPDQYMFSVCKLKMYQFGGTKKINVDGIEYVVPDEPERYLASIYTDSWRIPDPNWKSSNGPAFNKISGKYAKVEFFI